MVGVHGRAAARASFTRHTQDLGWQLGSRTPSAHHWGSLSRSQHPGPVLSPQTASSSRPGLEPPVGRTGAGTLPPAPQPCLPHAQRVLTLAQMLAALTTG